MYHIILYYTILYYVILYYIILHYIYYIIYCIDFCRCIQTLHLGRAPVPRTVFCHNFMPATSSA